MNHPHVTFQYNTEKDITNLNIGLALARNGKNADGEVSRIIRELGTNNPTDEQLRLYVEDWWRGKEHLKPLIIEPLQVYWNSVEQKFFKKLYTEMQLASWYGVEKINSFLSIRYGCGYNEREHWFATSVHASTFKNTTTAMHEIMHIFFHKQWWQFCEEQGVEENLIWDIKESFTTLLNIWFQNELIDTDFGYQEHQNLRARIREWHQAGYDFRTICGKACVYMKEYPNEHAPWKI